MSGLIGIIGNRDGARVGEVELDQLSATYESLRGKTAHTTMAAGGFARVRRLGDAVRHTTADRGTSWTLHSGRVHTPNGGATDVREADGQFAWCAYDATRDELDVASDPFGMQAFYVAERDGKTYLSTSALTLAKHLHARPSEVGLSVFLRTGYQFGTRTLWEGIERLDPATRIVFGADGTRRETYWRPSVDEDVTRLSLPDTVDRCRTVARETFSSYYLGTDDRSWADLTGGYDSRLLTMLLV